ncbi:MAG: glycosyltransferase family 2 protein [Paludibacteraceae bacterium]
MKISIITATYNSGRTLQRTIDSVREQDYATIEHIIIDGGSTDETLRIIEKNKSSISVFVSEKDNGIYDALNKGIKLATGSVIGFLNSDDVYYNQQVISEIVTHFESKKADVVYGSIVYQTKQKMSNKIIRYWESNEFDSRSLRFGWMPPHPTMYCLKEIYDKYGLYDDSYKIAADYDFILRVFKEPLVVKSYIPFVLVKMDVGGVSNNSLSNIYKKTIEDYKAIKKNKIGGISTLILKNFRKLNQFVAFRGKILPCSTCL